MFSKLVTYAESTRFMGDSSINSILLNGFSYTENLFSNLNTILNFVNHGRCTQLFLSLFIRRDN